MAITLRLQVVTPKGTAYSDDVEMVIVPGVEGQFGVLPHHVRLIAQMVPGELLVRKNGKDTYLAVGGGLVEVTAENVDEAKAEEARQRAAARLQEKISSEEVASVNAALARSLAQLRVKRHRHI